MQVRSRFHVPIFLLLMRFTDDSFPKCLGVSNKFGFFEKKHVCAICKRVVCVNDSRLQQLIPPATSTATICRKCNAYIKFHFHQAEMKRKLAEAQNNIAIVFYGTLVAIKDEIVYELPKFRGIVFSLSAIFGDSPAQQDKIREGIDDGGSLPFPGRTLEELFTQAMASQKRLKSVFAALEERLQGIQAASNDTKTQQRMIANLKQAMADFLTNNLPLFRYSSQRFAEIKDHPKTRRLLVEAKEQVRQEEIQLARKAQEEVDMKRYQALVGETGASPAVVAAHSGSTPRSSGESSHSSVAEKLVNKVVSKAQQVGHTGNSLLSSAYHSISRQVENLNTSHLIPEIAGVIPAICPTLGGIPLTLRGHNFHQNVTVFVDQKPLAEWQVLWKSPQELTIISPPLANEGPVDLAVQNPNQSQLGILEGVLFCTNDPAIMETLFGSPQPAAAPAIAPRPSAPNPAPAASSSSSPSTPSPSFLATSPKKAASFAPESPSKRSSLVEQHELPPGYRAAIAPSPFLLTGHDSEPIVGSPPSYATLPVAPKYTSQTNPPTAAAPTGAPPSSEHMKVSRTFGSRF